MMNPTIDKLQTLYNRNYDAERGYQTVAQEINNPSLKGMFESYSRQRHQFHNKIRDEIVSLGGDVNLGTSPRADLHQSWIQIKSLFTNGSEEAMLNEVVRGEDVLIAEYEDVLASTDLLPSTKATLEDQLELITKSKHQMQRLESVYA